MIILLPMHNAQVYVGCMAKKSRASLTFGNQNNIDNVLDDTFSSLEPMDKIIIEMNNNNTNFNNNLTLKTKVRFDDDIKDNGWLPGLIE